MKEAYTAKPLSWGSHLPRPASRPTFLLSLQSLPAQSGFDLSLSCCSLNWSLCAGPSSWPGLGVQSSWSSQPRSTLFASPAGTSQARRGRSQCRALVRALQTLAGALPVRLNSIYGSCKHVSS